jgi:HlyD family secretion protein
MRPRDDVWFGFNLREDALDGLAVGARVPVSIPGTATPVQARVSEPRSSGESATWRAARATGDHDLNTLFLRFDPVPPVRGIEPGAAVLLHPGRGTP